MPTNAQLAEGAIEILTMNKCTFACNILSICLEYVILWPYKLTAKVTKDMENMSLCKKCVFSSVASMVWWLLGTIATYLIYAYLSTHLGEESYYTEIHQGKESYYPDTNTVEESHGIYERMKRELHTDLQSYTHDPCLDQDWRTKPKCKEEVGLSALTSNIIATTTVMTTVVSPSSTLTTSKVMMSVITTTEKISPSSTKTEITPPPLPQQLKNST